MAARLRVGFAGTPPFAAAALSAIADAGFDIRRVLTRPDRPRGRGLKLVPGAVKARATMLGLDVIEPPSLKDGSMMLQVTSVAIDVLVVAAYGLILPPTMLVWPRFGCINIHASLLPRWRGAAPVQRALLAGDEETGISIMQMDSGLDTGPLIETIPIPVAPRETAGTLLDKLASAGSEAIVETLLRLQRDGRLAATPQREDLATYATKIGRSDAMIDWRGEASTIDRQVRALSPSPGASTSLGEVPIKLWDASISRGQYGAPGTVAATSASGIVVACGKGAIVIHELQRSGGQRMSTAAFLAGNPLAAGVRLGNAALPEVSG